MPLKNVLLIDKRVQAYETIVSSVNTALCIPIAFDYYTDTVQTIKARIISELSASAATSSQCIGLVQHNYNLPEYQFVFSSDSGSVSEPRGNRSVVTGVAEVDPALDSWWQLREFITWCKTTPEVSVQNFDMMACALYSDVNWKYVIDTLAAQTGVAIRASTDNTGSSAYGGNWFLESHTGVSLKDVYFSEGIESYDGVFLKLSYHDINKRLYEIKGFGSGNVVTWGTDGHGGDSNYPNSNGTSLNSGVVSIYGNQSAFAALKSDGSVITWGISEYGGSKIFYNLSSGSTISVASTLTSGVVSIYTTSLAFAALKNNGSVVSWGYYQYGGDSNYPNSNGTSLNSGVVAIYSNQFAFAALKNDGSVITWGDPNFGGDSNSPNSNGTSLNSGVVAIYSNRHAFAALKNDGSVITWGHGMFGGAKIIYTPSSASTSVASSLNSGVVSIYSSAAAFAALKNDGSVVTWGHSQYGGIQSIYTNNGSIYTSSVASRLTSGVVTIYSSYYAFAALKNDGSVITWGNREAGGDSDYPNSNGTSLNSGVVAVYSHDTAYAALKRDGSVVTWGETQRGGIKSRYNPDPGALLTYTPVDSSLNSGVVAIYSNPYGFAALKSDGSVVPWGFASWGGDPNYPVSNGTSLNSGVVSVYSTHGSFSALKSDGSVVSWGQHNYGGNQTIYGNNASVSSSLTSGVIGMSRTFFSYAALKTTETTFDLSGSHYTEKDRYDILRNKESQRRVNLNTLNNNVFRLSEAKYIQATNPNIPAGTIFKVIVPNYQTPSSYSINMTASIPS